MSRLILLLVPAALFAGQPRYARLGEFDGKVEVQLQAASPWGPAARNLPLPESAWLRTGPAARFEIELDEGSAFRVGPDSQIELSDYSRLSTGQRITVVSLDHGVAWFTGEPSRNDTLSLAVPGAQITFSRGARVRLQVDVTVSRISVIEGSVRLSCPAAELDIREGQTVRVEPLTPARFALDREIAPLELDRWSEERDKALESSASSSHVAQRYGVDDLDAAGEWLQTDVGPVWKPKITEGWAPFQNGHWRWYDTLGYTWVSNEHWGWLPYHYGRWTRKNDLGWVWAPSAAGAAAVFKPGDVYWLRGANFAAWGPLAPSEDWSPGNVPQQFLNVNTTYATFAQDAQVIDPEGFTDRPKEPLKVAAFALALPSPAWIPARLEAVRPMLRVGYSRVNPIIPGTTFMDPTDTPPPPPQQPPMPPPIVDPAPAPSGPQSQPSPGPPGPPMQVIYPVPVYTGIVVLNPPEHPDYSRRNPNNPAPAKTTTTPSTTPTAKPNTTPAPPRVNPLPPISRPSVTPSNPPPPGPKPDIRSTPTKPDTRPEPKTSAKSDDSKKQ
ncbi:MAG: hypothetical protein JWP63_850 [Candidatus Solibacter sp.]|nr:hypothetical protein [Candidatus Solibacter sp.]